MLSHYLVDYISLIIYKKGNLIFFFSHKNQLYLPALPDHNNRELGKKSDLIECMKLDFLLNLLYLTARYWME